MKMNRMSLFPSQIFEFHVDPASYDKQAIVDTVTENYAVDSHRNNWDPTSKLHHYYDDWQNPRFKQVPFGNLGQCYDAVFRKLFEEFDPKGQCAVTWRLANITVVKDGLFMNEHAHTDDNLFVSAVHYVKAPPNCNPLVFKNPLVYMQYENWFTRGGYMDVFGRANQGVSAWYQSWNYQPREDHMVVFPGWLRHAVESKGAPGDDLRIAIVLNVFIARPQGRTG